jgi:hypothetical protein
VSSSKARGFAAVVVGCLTSLVLRRIALLVYNASYATVLSSHGLSLEQLRGRMLSDPIILAGGLVVGFAAIFVGGFVAARVARQSELAYAAVTGLVILFVSAGLLACCGVLTVPRLYATFAYGLTVPSALLGGYAARWRAGKAPGASEATPPRQQ